MNYIDDYENQELEEYKNSCADFTLGVIEALKDYDRNNLLLVWLVLEYHTQDLLHHYNLIFLLLPSTQVIY